MPLIDLAHSSITAVKVLSNRMFEVKIVTQELSQEDAHSLLEAYWDCKQIDTRVKPEYKGKTPSERLRGALFMDWKYNNGSEGDFEAYYQKEMEFLIEMVKTKLPETRYGDE